MIQFHEWMQAYPIFILPIWLNGSLQNPVYFFSVLWCIALSSLPPTVYINFLLYSVAQAILDSCWLCTYSLIQLFVQRGAQLFATNFLSYNVHSLLHLVSEVYRFSPLMYFARLKFKFQQIYQGPRDFL